MYFRTYNQLWGKAQNEIQTVLSNESQAFIGKSEKVCDCKGLRCYLYNHKFILVIDIIVLNFFFV